MNRDVFSSKGDINMSRGGFKAFCVDVNGIVGGGSITDVEGVLSQITDGIVGTLQGWSFDSTKTASKNDFVNVGTSGRAQFLTHTGGAKLLVAMCISGGTTGSFAFNSCFNPEMGPTSNDGVISGGLCMSMIPPGKGDYDISKITDSDFMPNTALRLVGFGISYSSSYYPMCFVERSDMDDKMFRYMIVVRNDVIMAVGRRLDITDKCVFYAIGNFINCAQDSDINSFATFSPYPSYDSSSEGDDNLYSFSNSQNSDYAMTESSYGNCQIYARDGGLLSAKTTYMGAETTTARDATALVQRHVGLEQSYGSNSRRFVSFSVGMVPTSGDKSCGVVPYDCYKGIINPEVMCQIYHSGSGGDLSKSALLDNGNFIHLCNGVIIGWDSSNIVDFWI